MTFERLGHRILAAAVSAGLGFGLLSCSQSNTIDYVYLLSSKNPTGQINAYAVDSITGALTQIKGSPFSSGGADPVGVVTSPNAKYVYVINRDSNSISAFSIGAGGGLSALGSGSITTPGTEPVAIGTNPAGTFLFVVDHYAPGFSDATPGPGSVSVYPIGGDGTIGSPVAQTGGQSFALGNSPSAVTVLPNGNTLYVTEQLTSNAAGCNIGQGGVRALTVSSSGSLTEVASSPFCAGVTPSSIAVTPIGNFVYVTDSTQNQLVGYHVQNDGSLLPFVGGPIPTGTFPNSVTVEPRGEYMYVANRSAQTVQSYSIAAGTGIPSSTGTFGTGPFPQCVIVEPALARFVYTADFQGQGITGARLDPSTGILSGTENSPYVGTGLSTCVGAASHGNHPLIHVQGTAG